MKKKQPLLLGAHMSIVGGIDRAIARGESIGCTTIQLFTKNNRQWTAKKLTSDEIQLFKDAWYQSSIKQIVAHASYLINLGSPKKDVHKKSVAAIIKELRRCEQLGITYLVVHPGSHLKTGEQKSITRIAESLNHIFAQVSGKSKILLETMAGQGSTVCHRFEHIATILKQSNFKNRLGVCLDTCHVFAAGYDLRTSKTYESLWRKFDTIIGLKKLKVVHINDSKKDLGSHIDRHEDIGKGKIGAKAFQMLFNDKRFFNIPKILETPKESLDDDARNIKTIKKLISNETRKILQVD